MQPCPETETIQAYVDREISGAEAALIAAHLQSCPRCQHVHDWLLSISQSLSGRPQPAAREKLVQLIHNAVDSAAPVGAISCKRAGAFISPYLDGELAAAEQLLLWRHLFTCEQCYREFKQSEEIAAVMRRQTVPVPAGLAGRIYNAIEAEQVLDEVGVIRPARWTVPWRKVGAAAAGLAAAAALVASLLLGPRPPQTDQPVIGPPLPAIKVADVPAAPEEPVEPALPAVDEPETATPETPRPRRVTSPHRASRSRVAVRSSAPTPATDRPERSPGADEPTRIAVRDLPVRTPAPPETSATTSPAGSGLSPVGPEAPRPTTPVAPPLPSGDGARLAVHRPEFVPTPAVGSSGQRPLRYTPVARTSSRETLYHNSGPIAADTLIAASEAVNTRVALNQDYEERPEITLK